MSKTKRKRYSGAFKAKVGLEALMGIQDGWADCPRVSGASGASDAMERNCSRPSARDIRVAPAVGEDQEQLIAQLHEKIGRLSVEVDWLKKKCKQLGL